MENKAIYSDNVRFLPRVGLEYLNGVYEKKVLVLGESIYCCDICNSPKACKNQVCEIVEKQLNGKEKNKFYTLIPKLYIGDISSSLTIEEKIKFWNSVSFYEYVQTSVGTNPRVRPTLDMWQDSSKAFFEVIDILCPDIILITGKELANYVVNLFMEREKVFDSKKSFLIHNKAKYNNRILDLVCIYHPSSARFSYKIQDELFEIIK